MSYNHSDILSDSPYYDDFDDAKNFLKILFKPGYSIQARELTQLQTLLQNQVSKLGSHIFKNGSLVYGGVTTQTNCKFLRVRTKTTGSSIDHKTLRNKILTNNPNTTATDRVKAKVLYTLPSQSGDNYIVLFLQYLNGNEFTANTENIFDISNQQLLNIRAKPNTEATTIPSLGTSTLISVDSGIFYIDGFFVNNTNQTVALFNIDSGYRNFTLPTNRVGFDVVRKTIDHTQDGTLKDPANGSYNYNAPGADRYVLDLVLSSYTFDNKETKPEEYSTEDFIELARTVNGNLDFVRRTPTYSDLLDIFARRTYDESGSYTVRPFNLEVKNHIRSDKYRFSIESYSGPISSTPSITSNFVYSDPENNQDQLPPLPGDVLKIYNPNSNTDTFLDVVSVAAGITPPNSAAITVKYQDSSTNGFADIISNVTKMYLYRKGNPNPISNIFLLVTSTPVLDQDALGTYTIRDTPRGSEDKFVLSIQPGKAYVFGYEFETINNTNISVNKPRDTVFLDNYEVNTNIGNYFIAETTRGSDNLYKFNNYSSTLNINEFPAVSLKSDLLELDLPKIEDEYCDLPVKYWSPLYATEHRGEYSSVLFLNPNPSVLYALNNEKPSGSDVYGLVRPKDTDDPRKEIIGQQISPTTSVSYKINDSSFETETNISRLVFTEPYHGDFKTGFGRDGSIDNDDQFSTDEYRDSDNNYVYQIVYTDLGTLPTINSQDDLKSKINIKRALTRRWVPAGSSGITTGSTLYIKTPVNNVIFGNTTTFNQGYTLPGQNTTIGQEAGVVFNPEIGSNLSYGSSVESINLQNNVVQIILREATSSLDCRDTANGDQNESRGVGKYRIGDIITQTWIKDSITSRAEGRVLAVSESDQNGDYKIYVEISGSKDFIADGTAQYSNIGAVFGPCACYTAQSVTVLDNSTCGFFVAIKFSEGGDYGDYTKGNKVFQYDIDYLPIGTNFNANKVIAKGEVVSWDRNSRILVILQTQNQFKKKSGWVFEQGTPTRYGGRGWDLNKHNTEILSNIVQIEKTSGVFVDSDDNYINGKDFDEDNRYGNAKQVVVNGASQNYAEGKELFVNDIVTQTNSGITSRGRVVFFKSGNVDNPAATIEEGTTTIILAKDGTYPFNFVIGTSNAPVLRVLRNGQTTGITYSVNSTFVSTTGTENSAVIGTANIRQLHRISEQQYSVHLFNVVMNNIGSTTKKYNLFNTTKIAKQETSGLVDIFNITNVSGVSSIQAPQQNTLLFDLPVGDSINYISDFKYRIQRDFLLNIDSPTSNTFTITADVPANVRFIGGASGAGSEIGKIDNADLLEHYILVNVSTGKIYNLADTNYFTKIITNNTSEGSISELTLHTKKNTSGTNVLPIGNYRLIATMSVGGSTELGIRRKVKKRETKKLNFDSSGVLTIKRADVASVDYMTTLSGVIYDLSLFDFNNGQTDNIYEYATLKLKPENKNVYTLGPSTEVTICYTYFDHIGSGPIVANSYESHRDIPTYTSTSTNEKYNLDSVIDFRPYRRPPVGAETIGTLAGIYGIPEITESFTVDYSYYQAKNYKVVLTRDRQFKVIESPSSLNPIIPPDEPNSMTLFTIESPAYLSSVNDLNITTFNHQRFTMNDIRELERRIENLEYFTKLNLLEKSAQETVVTDSTGNELVKTSILVDGFTGHGIGDTFNPDYNCSIDPQDNVLRPPFKTSVVDLVLDSSESSNVTVNGRTNLATLNYTQEAMIVQPLSSGTIPVNTLGNSTWIGYMSITPTSDAWFDESTEPLILTNTDGKNDSFKNMIVGPKNNNLGAFGSKWNSWLTNWQGRQITPANRKPITVNRITRLPIDLFSGTVPNTAGVKVIDKVIETDIVPFMREKVITVTVTGLKPRTEVFPYFDGIRIDSYCSSIGGGNYVNGTNNITGNTGTTQFVFTLPSGKFRVGEKVITVMDVEDGNRANAQTYADCKFRSSGLDNNKNDYYVLPRPGNVSTTENTQSLIAQTFFVDSAKYPQGVFVKSVDLFFAATDTQNLPIKLEIRPVVSGYPSIGSGSIVYPYATSIVSSVNVISSTDTPTPGSLDGTTQSNGTRFTFEAPVHLLPGEHALVLSTNSSEYSIYSANIGENQINTTIPISEQPYSGKLFKTNNNSIWSEISTTDLMFVINRCNFKVNGSTTGSVVMKDPVQIGVVKENYSVANLNMSYVDFGGMITSVVLETLNENSSVRTSASIKPNTNTDFGISKKLLSDGQSVKAIISLKTDSDGIISPIVDIDRINMISVRNMVTTQTRTSEELESVATTAKARYITKTVTLDPGLEATDCTVSLKLYKPRGTAVDVYIKKQAQGTDKPFYEENYQLMIPNSNMSDFISVNDSDFRDVKYNLNQTSDSQDFSKFSIKVVLYSTDEGVIPKVKDLKIITAT